MKVSYKKKQKLFLFKRNSQNVLNFKLLTSQLFFQDVMEIRVRTELHIAQAKASFRSKHEIFAHSCHSSANTDVAQQSSQYKVDMYNYSRKCNRLLRPHNKYKGSHLITQP